MADVKIELTNSDPKWIADHLRKAADQWHKPFPWRVVIAFLMGMILVASMDYGDVWLCVGQCNQAVSP